MCDPKVGVVIVNYNGLDYTVDCLKSLMRSTWKNMDIIVVDNGSSDGSPEKLKALFGDSVFVVSNETNLAFAGGNNLGITLALEHHCTYALWLNNDTVVDSFLVDKMVKCSQMNGGAIVAPNFLSKMDRILVTSPNMKQSSACLRPFLDKVEGVPLFVDVEHFHCYEDNKREELLKEIGADNETKIILYVGRFGRYEGLSYLVKALTLLPENYCLVLIGDGPERPAAEQLVGELKLGHRVLRLDHVPYADLPKYYSVADVFVLPSVDRDEAFGLVVVEAMACGVPVVTTELGTGTSFPNINGVTGRVVPPRNERALADAIAEICKNKHKYDPQVIRKRAEEFSTENLIGS